MTTKQAMSGNKRIKIERIGMTGDAVAVNSEVVAVTGGEDVFPEGSNVEIREVAMEGRAAARNTNVHASLNRDLHIEGSATPHDVTVGTTNKGETSFGQDNTAALLVAGAGTSSELQIYRNDMEQVERLLRSKEVGIVEDKIFTVKARPSIAKTTKTAIKEAINDIKDVLGDFDNGQLVFYYTGHFTKSKGFKVDDKKKEDVDFYLDSELADELKKIPAKYILLIMDMCYSGSAELGAKDDDDGGLVQVPCLWEFLSQSIQTKSPGERGAGTAEKVVQWSSSCGNKVSYTEKQLQTSVFTKAIIDVITQPDDKKRIREELTSGQNHVTILHLHEHVKRRVQKALGERATQTPVIKPDGADADYFKTYPYFARLI